MTLGHLNVCLVICWFFLLIWGGGVSTLKNVSGNFKRRMQILTSAPHSWPVSSEGFETCHTNCDTGSPSAMVISEDTHTNAKRSTVELSLPV